MGMLDMFRGDKITVGRERLLEMKRTIKNLVGENRSLQELVDSGMREQTKLNARINRLQDAIRAQSNADVLIRLERLRLRLLKESEFPGPARVAHHMAELDECEKALNQG
jgi:predicted RNase H-like nuclease (RuvC/YqgF family)